MHEIIDPKGAYHYDPKELIPSSHMTEDYDRMKSQGHEYKVFTTLLCTYSMHVQPLEILVYM
jgi:hypothetical protein